ncbi:hypothetical protein [Sorangium sp. So ce1024]|uniref:hypothetical protein n=1 Tax=Sorangium sp. So ce1024 TaxID=3133327 RepID=UPI003F07574E
MSFRDPKRRVSLTLPGRPVTRAVSPDDIERYLSARGYLGVRSAQPGWPRDVALVWLPPAGPNSTDRYVEGPQVRSHRLEDAIKAIARIEGRTPGEVLREIAVMAQMPENGE